MRMIEASKSKCILTFKQLFVQVFELRIDEIKQSLYTFRRTVSKLSLHTTTRTAADDAQRPGIDVGRSGLH